MEDATDMGGVIIPSASSADPPIIAGNTSQRLLLRTKAYRENMPPSPLLSAFSVNTTYLIVVCKVSVHKIQESAPSTSSSDIILSLIIAFNTYKGEVPISPYIIPNATTKPTAVNLF